MKYTKEIESILTELAEQNNIPIEQYRTSLINTTRLLHKSHPDYLPVPPEAITDDEIVIYCVLEYELKRIQYKKIVFMRDIVKRSKHAKSNSIKTVL